MSLVRIAFAIIIGILVCALLEWLTTSVPRSLDILIGIAAGFIAYFSWPNIRGL